MGYRGKLHERQQARELRAEGLALADIAAALGVSKSSVSEWVRDVVFESRPGKNEQRESRARRPNVLQRRKQEEIDALDRLGVARIGLLSEQAFLAAGAALYAGEGSKTDGEVRFANTDPLMMRFFAAWLRHFFEIDESRLRMRIYLHEGLSIDTATAFWSGVVDVPVAQFRRPYRAKADPTIRSTKHEFGCAYLTYGCSRTHRAVMGLVRALVSCRAIPG